jgi:hypothetical protein
LPIADSGALAQDIVIGLAAFAPFPILGVLCWVFWRAKKREESEHER